MASKKQKAITLIIILFLVFLPFFVHARGMVPCGGYNADGTLEPRCTVEDIFVVMAHAVNYLLAMAGLYAVYVIIQASWGFTAAMGNEESLATKRKQITNAVVGVVLASMAFMIINTVVNGLLRSKCPISLSDPLTYLRITDYTKCTGPK